MISNSHGQVPHALTTAHEKLTVELVEGIACFEKNRKFVNASNVRRTVKKFVDALNDAGVGDELRRRAILIETACRAGSEYELARAMAMALHPIYSPGLRKPIGEHDSPQSDDFPDSKYVPPLFASDVEEVKEQIERALQKDTELIETTEYREAYQPLDACEKVVSEADRLATDGCWWLYNLHAASKREPTENAKFVRALMETRFGGANLTDMKAGADSLMAWAVESLNWPEIESGTGQEKETKRRGRPKANYEIVQQEEALMKEWERAKAGGACAVDFATEHSKPPKEFEKLRDRVAWRRKDANKNR